MASKIAEAYVQIVPRIDGVASSINKQLSGDMATAGGKAGDALGGGLLGSIKRVAGPMAAALATAGVGKFLKDSVSAASNFQAEFEGVNQTFGKFATEVQAYAKTAAQSAGLSEVEALRSAKSFGVFAKSAGLSGVAAADFSIEMVQLAGDLGSFNDVPVDEALAAIQSGLLGQAEPLRKFGVLLDDATLKARAQEMGIYAGTGALTAQQKVLAAQAEILAQTTLQQGDFNKYQDDFGNALKTTSASLDNVKKSVGVAFLPAMTEIVIAVRDNVMPQLQKMADALPNLFAKLSSPAGITQGLKSISESVVAWVEGGGIMTLINGFVAIRARIVEALAVQLPQIVSSIAMSLIQALPSIAQALLAIIPQLLQTALTVFNSLVTAVVTVVPAILLALSEMLPQLITTIINMLPGIINSALQLFTGIIDGLLMALPLIITAFVEAIPKILRALVDALPAIIEAAVTLFTGITEGILKALPVIIDSVQKLIPVITQALIEATPMLIEAGIAILTGLAKGIVDNAPRLIGAAMESVAGIVTNTFKNLLGIHSPSRVFEGYGKNIGEGLVEGMDSMQGAVEKSAAELGSYANKGFTMSLKELTDAGNYGVLAGSKFFQATDPSQVAARLNQGGVLDVNGVTMADVYAAYRSDAAGLAGAEAAAKKSGKDFYSSPALMALLEKAGFDYSQTWSKQQMSKDTQTLLNKLNGTFTVYNDNGTKTTSTPIKQLTSAYLNSENNILKAGTAFDDITKASIQTFIEKQKFQLESAINQGFGEAQTSSLIADIAKAEALLPMARGGFVNRPTRALIGEAGPEVVTPLKDFERMMGIGGFERNQQKVIHYHAAPNESIDREEALFKAMRRAKVVAGW